MEPNFALLVHFVGIIITYSFTNKFSVLSLEVCGYLKRVIRVNVLAASSTYELMKKSADTSTKPVEETMFAKSPDAIIK